MTTRRTQVVATKAQREIVMEWMKEEVDECGSSNRIASKAVTKFPAIFPVHDQKSRTAFLKQAYRWWLMHEEYLNALKTNENKALLIRSKTFTGISDKKSELKTLRGRGRKRSDWKEYLHSVLLTEFEKLSSAGVKLSRNLMRDAALLLLSEDDSQYSTEFIDNSTGQPIMNHITLQFIDAFLSRFNIVVRVQCGSLLRSDAHFIYTKKKVAYHLGTLKRSFTSGEYIDGLVDNMDETHFFFNLDNHKSLGFKGCKKVNYADVVAGGDGFTVVLRMTGGINAKLHAPFLIFKNKNRNYPMKNLPDNLDTVTYRTGSSAWMNRFILNP